MDAPKLGSLVMDLELPPKKRAPIGFKCEEISSKTEDFPVEKDKGKSILENTSVSEPSLTVFLGRDEEEPGDESSERHRPACYLCKYCDRQFTTSQALGGHQNAHKKEREIQKAMKTASDHFGLGSLVYRYPGLFRGPYYGYRPPPLPRPLLPHPYYRSVPGGWQPVNGPFPRLSPRSPTMVGHGQAHTRMGRPMITSTMGRSSHSSVAAASNFTGVLNRMNDEGDDRAGKEGELGTPGLERAIGYGRYVDLDLSLKLG